MTGVATVAGTFLEPGLEADLPAGPGLGLPKPVFYPTTDTHTIWRSDDYGATWDVWLQASAAAGLNDLTDVDLTGLADNNTLVYDLASGLWKPEAPSGGSSGLGTILGIAEKTNNATSATTSTTDADVDATNLAIAFTVPASGRVLVTQSAVADTLNPSSPMVWSVRSGSTTVKSRTMGNAYSSLYAEHLISGLTPGASLTYKWGYKSLSGGTCDIYSGGASGTAGNPIMKVVQA